MVWKKREVEEGEEKNRSNLRDPPVQKIARRQIKKGKRKKKTGNQNNQNIKKRT